MSPIADSRRALNQQTSAMKERAEFRRLLRAVAPLAIWALFAALLEAGALMFIAYAATATASGKSSVVLPAVGIGTSTSMVLIFSAAFAIAFAGARLWSARQQGRTAAAWQADRRRVLLNAYLAADWKTLATIDSGELINAAGLLATRAADSVGSLATMLRSTTSIAILGVGALVLDPTTALTLLGFGSMLFLVLKPMTRWMRQASARSANALSEQAGRLAQVSALTQEILVYGAQDATAASLGRTFRDLEESQTRSYFLLGGVPALYSALGLLLVVAVLGALMLFGVNDLASFGATALILLRSLSYGQAGQAALQRFTESQSYRQRLDREIERLVVDPKPTGTTPITSVETVEFSEVSYRYGNDDVDALKGVNVRLLRGEIVGIVGESGSGKSTFAQLLARLRAPSFGRILVNGVPIEEIGDGWSRAVALVPQRPQLLDGTLAENVAFLREGIDEQAIEGALSAAGLGSLLTELPQGLQTPLGRKERELSGGQLQRLVIARALAGQPSMLIMDEPTSALDAQSEATVAEAIANLRGRCLVAVIAHRPSTISACDRVLAFESGSVVEAADAVALGEG